MFASVADYYNLSEKLSKGSKIHFFFLGFIEPDGMNFWLV